MSNMTLKSNVLRPNTESYSIPPCVFQVESRWRVKFSFILRYLPPFGLLFTDSLNFVVYIHRTPAGTADYPCCSRFLSCDIFDRIRLSCRPRRPCLEHASFQWAYSIDEFQHLLSYSHEVSTRQSSAHLHVLKLAHKRRRARTTIIGSISRA